MNQLSGAAARTGSFISKNGINKIKINSWGVFIRKQQTNIEKWNNI